MYMLSRIVDRKKAKGGYHKSAPQFLRIAAIITPLKYSPRNTMGFRLCIKKG